MSNSKSLMGDTIGVFGGSASQGLTRAICDHLGLSPGKSEVLRFPGGNLFVRIQENVRGRDVFLVQSTAYPANDNFMELLFWIDAFKRASANSVTAIVPFFSYAKGDKKDEPRVSIRARVCADAIEAAGADRVLTVDLHAPQIQGFFKIPVDDLYAWPVLSEAVRLLDLEDLLVVSPDHGFAKKARRYAAALGAPLLIADKHRLDHAGGMLIATTAGSISNRCALIVDDFTVSGKTLVTVAARLAEMGVRDIYAAVTHGIIGAECLELIEQGPIRRLLVTDTVENQVTSPRVAVVSIAPLLAEAIRRIQNHESISVLFPTK